MSRSMPWAYQEDSVGKVVLSPLMRSMLANGITRRQLQDAIGEDDADKRRTIIHDGKRYRLLMGGWEIAVPSAIKRSGGR